MWNTVLFNKLANHSSDFSLLLNLAEIGMNPFAMKHGFNPWWVRFPEKGLAYQVMLAWETS